MKSGTVTKHGKILTKSSKTYHRNASKTDDVPLISTDGYVFESNAVAQRLEVIYSLYERVSKKSIQK